MIPNIPLLTTEIIETAYPSKTYKIVFVSQTEFENNDRISGYTDDLQALIQSVYLILNTERYEYIIYSWDYGVELIDLIGKPIPYVLSEIPHRIKDALMQDDRINDVVDFEFDVNRGKVHTTFKIVSNLGTIGWEMEVGV